MTWKTLCPIMLTAVSPLLRPGEGISQVAAGRDFEAEIEAALRSAKTAAGFEFIGALNRNCLLPASGGLNTSNNLPRYVQDLTTIPPRESWYAESAQVFDNLYFVGAESTPHGRSRRGEGIIIIDTVYPYNSEELIIGGLERAGLDPVDIRYVIISHAHGDHIGGAQILQERFGAEVVMGEADWELIETYPNRYASMAPERGIVATDGMELTLGDTTVEIWETPGHTPGTLSYTFTAFDNGKAGRGRLFGWHGLQLPQQHTGSGDPELPDIHRFAAPYRASGAGSGATVLLSNPHRVRQCIPAEPDDCGPGRRSSPVRGRRRGGAAVLPGPHGVCPGGAAEARAGARRGARPLERLGAREGEAAERSAHARREGRGARYPWFPEQRCRDRGRARTARRQPRQG